MFIIGRLRERGRFKVLSEAGSGEQADSEIKEKIRTGLYAIPKEIIPGNQAHRVYDSEGVSITIKAEGGGLGAKTGLYAVPKINPLIQGKHSGEIVLKGNSITRAILSNDSSGPQNVAIPKINTVATGNNQKECVQDCNGIARTLTATDYKEPQTVAIPCITPDRMNKRQNGRRFKEVEGAMFTLTAQDRHGVLIYNGKEYYIRRLTPRECFRLQGFTDEQFDKAQAVNSNSQLYKQAGNAVTVNVAYFLGKELKRIEDITNRDEE